MSESKWPNDQATRAEFTVLCERTASILKRAVGEAAGGIKPHILLGRLTQEFQRHGNLRLADWIGRAERHDPQGLEALRNLVSVAYSRFWREATHWPILSEHLRIKFRAGHPVRLWSAATATGEEAYSIAMVASHAADAQATPKPADWWILATDIDTEALARAQAGCYSDLAVEALPMELRSRYLTRSLPPAPPDWVVDPDLRARIEFAQFDLAYPRWSLSSTAPFDVIFLCNVLIYLGRKVQARVLENLAHWLKPDGILLTSRSEGGLVHAASHFKACGQCAYIPRAGRVPQSIRGFL